MARVVKKNNVVIETPPPTDKYGVPQEAYDLEIINPVYHERLLMDLDPVAPRD